MNLQAILSLIADLYSQVQQLQTRVAELEGRDDADPDLRPE